MLRHRLPKFLTLLLLASSATVGDVAAQAGPQSQPGPGGWAPPSLGPRFGYDNRQQAEMLGAQLRIPVVPSGTIELMPSMDVTFLLGTKDYQYNIEGAYVLDGRAGGLYGGAGLVIRKANYGDGLGRRHELGYTGVIGLRLVQLGLVVPQIEYRWVFINAAPITYQQLSVGLSVAPWRHVRAP